MKKIFYLKSWLVSGLVLLLFNLIANAGEIELRKKFELGSEDKKDELFFEVRDLKVDRNGNIFILDSGNYCLKKFSSSYQFVAETGKKGQGPGDMMNPMSIDIDTKGNIYLYDLGNRKISIFDNELNYQKTIKLEKFDYFTRLLIDSHGHLLLVGNPMIEGKKYIYKFTPEGKFILSFFDTFHPYAPKLKAERGIQNYSSLAMYFISRSTINKDRTLIAFTHLVPENPYKVYLLNTDGDVESLITKKIKGYNPEKQRKYYKNIKKEDFYSGTSFYIENIHFTKDNCLLIQKKLEIFEENQPVIFKFLSDIFSLEGNLIEENIEMDRILFIDSKNNIYTLKEEDDGTVKISIYAMKITSK